MPTSTKANSAARLHQKALTLPGANPVSLVGFGLLNTSTGALGAYIDASGFLVGPTGSPLASSNDYKDSVRLASTAALAAVTYDNSAGTLTANAVGALSVDSVATALGDRLLIKNQVSDFQNGLFTVTTLGTAGVAFVLTRATDFDLWTEMPGAVVSVEVGTVNAGTQWVCNVAAGGTLGTTAITFVVPKNYVDLTTNQTIAGTKTFGTVVVTTLNGNAVTTGTGTLTLSTYTLTATASGNIYVSGGTDVEVSDGGTGRSTGTTAYALVATGTTATGAQQTLASGATTEVLVGGGPSALPVWTTATGSGAPVRATSPALVTPALGTPASGNLGNCDAATTTTKGVVELATQAEAEAGSDTGRPPAVANVLAAIAHNLAFGHGLMRQVAVAYNYASSGAGSSAAISSNGFSMSSGTANAGYGIARFQRDITTFPSSTGSGINFSKPMAVAFTLTGMAGSANASIRVIVGESDSSAPAAKGANALTAHGFGCEFGLNGATISDVFLFAHNGTTYVTSSWAGLSCLSTTDPPYTWTRLVLTSDGAGNIALYLASATLNAARPSTTPILTLAGGPTGLTGANRTVAIACVSAAAAAAAQTGTDFNVIRGLFPATMTVGTT